MQTGTLLAPRLSVVVQCSQAQFDQLGIVGALGYREVGVILLKEI